MALRLAIYGKGRMTGNVRFARPGNNLLKLLSYTSGIGLLYTLTCVSC